ncbi:MAG: hypothetical protein AAF250_13170 [Pseudomonadota bacterium]
MTSLAIECVERSQSAPINCSDLHDQIDARIVQDRPEDIQSLSYATRWPDDPQRVLDQTSTQIRFGLPLLQGCETALNRGETINRTGLLCASHYGRLQFMHAMMSPQAIGEFERQRELILAWAEFAFKVSTEAEFANLEYCSTVSSLENIDLRAALTFDNAEQRGSFCFQRRHPVYFWKTYKPWKVSTLFAFSCEEPINLNTCGVVSDVVAQQAAAGAILHLIQDSYSQSHASRRVNGAILAPTGPFDARVVCAPVRAFYIYQEQTGKEDRHKPADASPMLDESCATEERQVDDVITASAMAVHYIRNSNLSGFNDYLSSRVFPKP